jgi:hypothetical protein
LSAELASLEGSGAHSKARLDRLALELDQTDRQLAAFRHVAQATPTPRDVVMTADRPRTTTNEHFTEMQARNIFPDADLVEGTQVVAEHGGHVGWGLASGLIECEAGAMVQQADGTGRNRKP